MISWVSLRSTTGYDLVIICGSRLRREARQRKRRQIRRAGLAAILHGQGLADAAECLKPCPEQADTRVTLAICGWVSMMKLKSGVMV